MNVGHGGHLLVHGYPFALLDVQRDHPCVEREQDVRLAWLEVVDVVLPASRLLTLGEMHSPNAVVAHPPALGELTDRECKPLSYLPGMVLFMDIDTIAIRGSYIHSSLIHCGIETNKHTLLFSSSVAHG